MHLMPHPATRIAVFMFGTRLLQCLHFIDRLRSVAIFAIHHVC